MINTLSIVVYAFLRRTLISLSINEILLLWYVKKSTNFRGLPLKEEMDPSYILVEANAFCCLLSRDLYRCIFLKR